MSRIDFTNVIVDDFSICKKDFSRQYVHILTHIHTDHLKGLNDSWNYGTIYCSKITKQLILLKFPNLRCLEVIELETPTVVKMSDQLEITITFFDANHCYGAVMVLLQGYMGKVLYTGDIRFNKQKFKQSYYLYPANQSNQSFEGCSKQIDTLYLDNTFLKKKHQFPPQEESIRMLDKFIDKLKETNQYQRVYIGMDNHGKQEVLVHIAEKYQTFIVVDETRYQAIQAMEIDPQLFTTFKSEGEIQVVKKAELKAKLRDNPESIGIVLTGWANQPYYAHNNRIYKIPYSSHSNYNEIHAFVKSIQPSEIKPIVGSYTFNNNDQVYRNQIGELVEEQSTYTSQLVELARLYCSKMRPEYKQLKQDIELQKSIQQKLLMPKPLQLDWQEQHMAKIGIIMRDPKKYKFTDQQRDEEELLRIKNNLKFRKKEMEGDTIHIASQEDQVMEIQGSGQSQNMKKVFNKVRKIRIKPAIHNPIVIEIDQELQHGNQQINQNDQIQNLSAISDKNFLQINQISQSEQQFDNFQKISNSQLVELEKKKLQQQRRIKEQEDKLMEIENMIKKTKKSNKKKSVSFYDQPQQQKVQENPQQEAMEIQSIVSGSSRKIMKENEVFQPKKDTTHLQKVCQLIKKIDSNDSLQNMYRILKKKQENYQQIRQKKLNSLATQVDRLRNINDVSGILDIHFASSSETNNFVKNNRKEIEFQMSVNSLSQSIEDLQ